MSARDVGRAWSPATTPVGATALRWCPRLPPAPPPHHPSLARACAELTPAFAVVRLTAPWRPDGGPRDDFERQALQALRRYPEQPVARVESFQGRPALRYATADRMRAPCVSCHNTHPAGPKTTWQEGDVRGVVEVILPLERAVARVTQILTNLLANAQKYTPTEGSIRITARGEEGRVRVSVQDTGIGLSPEDQAQLFTPFSRAPHAATQGVGGTGLGLAITRALVERHGGTITVTSTLGQGSTFSVTLPTQGPEETTADAAPGPGA